MKTFIVFYAGLVYMEGDSKLVLHELPDGAYIYYPKGVNDRHWYLKDLTPVLLQDVPKELLLNVLLLT